MLYKLLERAQTRWRCVSAAHVVALVRGRPILADWLVTRPC